LAVGLPMQTTAGESLPHATPPRLPKLKVVVAGGHPGDPEYGCGGTIARYSDLGHEVVLLYLNQGEGTNRPAGESDRVRVVEARNACAILKARPAFAGQIDGKAIVDPVHYEQFHRLLEAEQPNVVFTHWPIHTHPDHRAASLLTYDAWLRAGKKFPLYFYEVESGQQTQDFWPTHYVDITAVADRKKSACYANTLTVDGWWPIHEQMQRSRGNEKGCKFAEAFNRHPQSPNEPALP